MKKMILFVLVIMTMLVWSSRFLLKSYPNYAESDHYSPEHGQFFNPIATQDIEKWGTIKGLWQLLIRPEKFSPAAQLPIEKPDFSAFLQPDEQSKFIWFGHSTLLARVGDQTLFIDPILVDYASPVPIMMKRFQAPPARLDELPPIDLIIYSHNHYDHLDSDVVKFYAEKSTRFIVPLGMSVDLIALGVQPERIVEMDWWQTLELGVFRLTAVPARHNTGRTMWDKNRTLWQGYVFQTAQEKIYFSGDSAFGDGQHFAQIGEHFGGFDLAFVENGQYNEAWHDNHMFPEQTAKAVELVQARRFMPIHWGAYPLAPHPWDEPVSISLPLVEQQGISLLTPKLGELFNKETQTIKWWE